MVSSSAHKDADAELAAHTLTSPSIRINELYYQNAYTVGKVGLYKAMQDFYHEH